MTEGKKEQKIMATKTEAPAVHTLRDLSYALAARYKIPLGEAQLRAEALIAQWRNAEIAKRNAPAIAAAMKARETANETGGGVKINLRDLARSIAAHEGCDLGTAQRKAEALIEARARRAFVDRVKASGK